MTEEPLNIIHLISNRTWGGGERYALDLCRRCAADGHSIAVVTRGIEAVDSRFAAAGFKPGHLPLGGPLDLVSPLQLARILNRLDAPVIVHTHNFKDARPALTARRLRRRPRQIHVVTTRHLARPADTGATAKATYGGLDAIVFVSETARRTFLSSSPAVDHGRLHVIHNSLLDTAAEHEPANADAPLRLLYCGRLCAEKGLHTLIEALEQMPAASWQLTVAGEGKGTYVLPLMRRCRQAGIDGKVDWAGPVDDIAPLLAAADAGIVPTVAPEAFGLSILEFMQAGMAVVTTDNGAQPELITAGENGILVPPSDSKALAAAIGDLIADRQLAAQLGASARRKALAVFGYDNFYKNITGIYRRCLSPDTRS